MFEVVLIIFFAASAYAFVQWWRGPDIPTDVLAGGGQLQYELAATRLTILGAQVATH